MKDNHTISVSDVFYRDPNMHPDVEVHPPGSEANPVLLEVIIAAILSTKGTMGEKPWPDMNVVRRAFWTDDAVQRAVTKLLNAESSKSATASASDSGTGEPTESDVAVVHALPQWSHGRHAKYNSLHCYINGDKVWKMRLSDSTDALFERLSASVEEPSSDAESICPTPSPPTQSAPQSPSSAPESSSDLTQADAVTLRLGKYLGTGKNYDVYAGTIDVRGKQFDVAFKYIDLTHYTKREDYDYGRTQFCRVHNDIKMMLSAHDRVPHVAPRFFGLWSYNESQYLLAIEHCGTPCDLTHVPTANEVRGIYLKLHAAGLRHNGLHSRHILRDNHGRIRIIDWEGGWLGTPHECGPEILGVERMVR